MDLEKKVEVLKVCLQFPKKDEYRFNHPKLFSYIFQSIDDDQEWTSFVSFYNHHAERLFCDPDAKLLDLISCLQKLWRDQYQHFKTIIIMNHEDPLIYISRSDSEDNINENENFIDNLNPNDRFMIVNYKTWVDFCNILQKEKGQSCVLLKMLSFAGLCGGIGYICFHWVTFRSVNSIFRLK